MVAAKKQSIAPAAATTTSTSETQRTGRKPWVRRTPVDVVLDQIKKQEERVADLQAELEKEKGGLERLKAARKVLEGT